MKKEKQFKRRRERGLAYARKKRAEARIEKEVLCSEIQGLRHEKLRLMKENELLSGLCVTANFAIHEWMRNTPTLSHVWPEGI